jgi:hypothetical protein
VYSGLGVVFKRQRPAHRQVLRFVAAEPPPLHARADPPVEAKVAPDDGLEPRERFGGEVVAGHAPMLRCQSNQGAVQDCGLGWG